MKLKKIICKKIEIKDIANKYNIESCCAYNDTCDEQKEEEHFNKTTLILNDSSDFL